MFFIAHRGNINGENKEEENKPEYILKAINQGYDVETDVWIFEIFNNHQIYLGHDHPEHKVDLEFLVNNKDKLWCHCKNLTALEFLLNKGLHCFVHDTDDATLTSKGYVWTYPGKQQIQNSILVKPDYKKNADDTYSIEQYLLNNGMKKITGICSDNISIFKNPRTRSKAPLDALASGLVAVAILKHI